MKPGSNRFSKVNPNVGYGGVQVALASGVPPRAIRRMGLRGMGQDPRALDFVTPVLGVTKTEGDSGIGVGAPITTLLAGVVGASVGVMAAMGRDKPPGVFKMVTLWALPVGLAFMAGAQGLKAAKGIW